MNYSAEVCKKLEEGVAKVFNDQGYKDYLRTANKFHNYSAQNVMLIQMQMPNATLVAGFSKWKSMDRYVKKGEKAIKILAPIPHKVRDENDQEKVLYTSFRAVNVFDVSQTDGKELPSSNAFIKPLTGDVVDYDNLVMKLKKATAVPIRFDKIDTNGYYHLKDKEIVINEGMSKAQTIKTMVHEIAHSILHDKEDGTSKDSKKDDREVQAESVAFQVCDYLGIDTSDYSFGYIAGWSQSRSLKELLASMGIITKTAYQIIEAVERG